MPACTKHSSKVCSEHDGCKWIAPLGGGRKRCRDVTRGDAVPAVAAPVAKAAVPALGGLLACTKLATQKRCAAVAPRCRWAAPSCVGHDGAPRADCTGKGPKSRCDQLGNCKWVGGCLSSGFQGLLPGHKAIVDLDPEPRRLLLPYGKFSFNLDTEEEPTPTPTLESDESEGTPTPTLESDESEGTPTPTLESDESECRKRSYHGSIPGGCKKKAGAGGARGCGPTRACR
jgi:hypothetical protein